MSEVPLYPPRDFFTHIGPGLIRQLQICGSDSMQNPRSCNRREAPLEGLIRTTKSKDTDTPQPKRVGRDLIDYKTRLTTYQGPLRGVGGN